MVAHIGNVDVIGLIKSNSVGAVEMGIVITRFTRHTQSGRINQSGSENLHAVIPVIGHVDVACTIESHTFRLIELIVPCALAGSQRG